jgi:hypothetical protein
MKTLGRSEILGAQDLARELVPCPEWGGAVWVRTMTAAERDEWEASRLHGEGRRRDVSLENMRASLVAACAVDEHGNRLFDDADVEALGAKSARALDRLFQVAQRLNGVTAEDLDEITKHLKNGHCASSPSGSP